jgi:hypothetical protein
MPPTTIAAGQLRCGLNPDTAPRGTFPNTGAGEEHYPRRAAIVGSPDSVRRDHHARSQVRHMISRPSADTLLRPRNLDRGRFLPHFGQTTVRKPISLRGHCGTLAHPAAAPELISSC